jgi:hypothetical protein
MSNKPINNGVPEMIYTFAGRSVALVGKFDTPIEIMQVIIQGLGGNIILNPDPHFHPRIYVIGKHSGSAVLEYFTNLALDVRVTPIIVHEARFDEFVLDGFSLEERIVKLLPQFPWYAQQLICIKGEHHEIHPTAERSGEHSCCTG